MTTDDRQRELDEMILAGCITEAEREAMSRQLDRINTVDNLGRAFDDFQQQLVDAFWQAGDHTARLNLLTSVERDLQDLLDEVRRNLAASRFASADAEGGQQ